MALENPHLQMLFYFSPKSPTAAPHRPGDFRTDWRILVVRMRSRATLAMVLVTKLTKIELHILDVGQGAGSTD